MTLRHAPFWYDRFPKSRRPAYPRQRGRIETEVVIVGGGLTGCACARLLTAAGIAVVLVERDRIGAGATGGALGVARQDFDVPFRATVQAHGLRAARALWQALRHAALDLPATLRRLKVGCDLTPQDLVDMAAADRADANALRREYDARHAAGFDHRWLSAPAVAGATGLERAVAIRTKAAVVDPYRACLGLAAAAVAAGAEVFERSQVRRIRAAATSVEVATAAGVIAAQSVVVATGAPLGDLRSLRRHLQPRRGYGVVSAPLAAAMRKQLGPRDTVLRDGAAAPRFVRWLKDDRVMITGADQDLTAAGGRDRALVQRAGHLMYELSLLYPPISGTPPEWSWSYTFDDTIDGLPYVGAHRHYPRHLFALGLGRHGAAAAWLAAKVLVRRLSNAPAAGDELLGFSRILAGH